MNILFLTDSLGYPRVDGFGTSASKVWTYSVSHSLTQKGLKFFYDMKPFRDSRSLLLDTYNHCLSYEPKLVILQIGIVDCYPRALKKFELQILSRIPFINSVSKKIITRNYRSIVNFRNIAYVDPIEFKSNLITLKNLFSNSKFLVIPIAPPTDNYIKKNPLVETRIIQYNSIKSEVFGNDFFSTLYDEANTNEIFLEDNHHLSKAGHDYVSFKITKRILELIENREIE